MTTRTQKTIDIFLDALNNGTLAKGTCKACAVGNLVAFEMGIKPIVPLNQDEDFGFIQGNEQWTSIVSEFILEQSIYWDLEKAKKQIDLTDFSVEELRLIERAFESTSHIKYYEYAHFSSERVRQDQLKGLTAVVNLLLEWDKDNENTVDEVFTSRAELIPIK